MPKYRVSIPYNATFTVEVEANNKEEAKELAEKESPSLCNQCSNDLECESPSDYETTIEEIN